MDGSRQIAQRLNHCYDLLRPSALFSYADDGGGSSSGRRGWGTFQKETGDLAAGIDAGIVLGSWHRSHFLTIIFFFLYPANFTLFFGSLRVYCKP